MLGKFGMWWKCSLYEDSVRIPCIAAGPDFKAGVRLATPVDLHDLQASCFSVTGARRPPDWVGTPLNLITAEDGERPVFSEYHGHGTRSSSYMIRRGKWKYIYHVKAPAQLFDLECDPEELNNRAGQEQTVAAELHRVLLAVCDPEVEDKRAEALIEQQIAILRR
jgi:choline-sulfatase